MGERTCDPQNKGERKWDGRSGKNMGERTLAGGHGGKNIGARGDIGERTWAREQVRSNECIIISMSF